MNQERLLTVLDIVNNSYQNTLKSKPLALSLKYIQNKQMPAQTVVLTQKTSDIYIF